MTTLHFKKSIGRSSSRLTLLLIALVFAYFALSQRAQAVVPPPDRGYAESNTAEGQNRVPSASPFAVGASTHVTRADPQTAVLQFPNASEIGAEIDTVSSVSPTRSSFMASWDRIRGAKGYSLDVSASSAFSTYVDGYHGLDVGNVTGRVVTALSPGTTYYYRVRPYGATARGYSEVMSATTATTVGLIINPTLDSSIISNQNGAAIEAMINRAIGVYESLFSDQITIQILFRYSTTAPDGTPLPQGALALSNSVLYSINWDTFINALRADATTYNDNLANENLPGAARSTYIRPKGANGRAVGLNTPPAMFGNGTIGQGGPYDGIVTLNSSQPFYFAHDSSSGCCYDAQRTTEHEIDEAMGLGSYLNTNQANLLPQDLFSWSSAGVRNLTSDLYRYFSIDSGRTNIVFFSQDANGDFGDWQSRSCPQAQPYVQNAFSCRGQPNDVFAASPEGINLDVIGYDRITDSILNGDFETGSFSDWGPGGHPPVITNLLRHTGTYCAQVGFSNVGLSGDSSLFQQFTVPSCGGTLSFWHWEDSSDTITHAWQDAYITDGFGTILQTIFHQCATGERWIQETVNMAPYAGQVVRINFLVHQNAGTTHVTRMFVDNVSLQNRCPEPPPATTDPATNRAASSATLNGRINLFGAPTGVHFEYGTTTNYGSTTASRTYNGTTMQSVSANITGLNPNTTYHFRLVGNIFFYGTIYSSDRTFTTLSVTGFPVVATTAATNVASFSARLNGSLYPHGLTTTVYFQYGTTTSYGFTTAPQSHSENTYLNIAPTISGLAPHTTYHFRIVATNNAGTRYGSDKTFTTLTATGLPVVTTKLATNRTTSSATLNGSLDPHGLTTTVYFRWGTTTSYGHTTPVQTQTGNTYRNITANISALPAHYTYHFRIVATNSAGTRMGSDQTFKTP